MSKVRSFILGYSTTTICKWMGKNGWPFAKASKVVENLASVPVSRSTIITALNDGRSEKYNTDAAPLIASEIAQLEAASLSTYVRQVNNEVLNSATLSDLQDRLAKLEQAAKTVPEKLDTRKVEIVIRHNDLPPVKLEEEVHPIFEQVLFHLNCGDNVMLVGPSGCGKTFLVGQVSKYLSAVRKQTVDYAILSLSGGVTEGKIFGRCVPNITTGKNEFQSTPYVDSYEKGGLILLDECDAGDPNVLLSLNLSLEKDFMNLDRPGKSLAKRHKDFVCMAAANTWGNGADRQYVGRNQQDSAFSQRFVQLGMDYDVALERRLCPGADELVNTIHKYRANTRAARVERIISTRFICRAFNWLRHGKSLSYVDSMLFAGWKSDEIRKVKGIQ